MNESIKLLQKINIHPTLWVVMGIAVITAHFTQILMLFCIVFVHEMGHAVIANHFNWRIKAIQILPFGGSVETEEYGNKSMREELLVILAGPIQHLWLVGVAYLMYTFSFVSFELYQQFFYMNSAVMLFNLLPIWPLDGGKLLFLGLSLKRSFIDAHRLTILLSTAIAILGFFYILLTAPLNLNAWIIAGFIIFTLVMEWKQRYFAFIRFLLERHYGRNSTLEMLKPIKVDQSEKIIEVLERFQRGCKHPVIVLKDGRESGALDENEILHAYFSDKLTSASIGELLYSY